MNVNRLRFVATVVLGFFTLAAVFLGFASASGGGLVGLAWSALAAVIVAVVSYLLWPVFAGKTVKQAYSRSREKATLKQPTAPVQVTYEAVCNPGPYDVEAGNPTKVPLNVQRGDRVIGDVSEDENYKFNCYVADSANYVKLVNQNRGFKPIFKGEGYGAYHVDTIIPYDAQWYAVLDAYGQQYTREVHVNLKRAKRN